jgi:ABC-type branched-subunit amino acid transport system substrate-binding protein
VHALSDGIVTISNFISSLDKPEAREFVKKVRDRYGPSTIVSNTTDAHYNLMRFYIGGIERAQGNDKEKVTDDMVDQDAYAQARAAARSRCDPRASRRERIAAGDGERERRPSRRPQQP